MVIYFASDDKNRYYFFKKILDMFPFELLFYKSNSDYLDNRDIKSIVSKKTMDILKKINSHILTMDERLFVEKEDSLIMVNNNMLNSEEYDEYSIKLNQKAYLKCVICYLDAYFSKPFIYEYLIEGKINIKNGLKIQDVFIESNTNKSLSSLSEDEIVNILKENKIDKFLFEVLQNRYERKPLDMGMYFIYQK